MERISWASQIRWFDAANSLFSAMFTLLTFASSTAFGGFQRFFGRSCRLMDNRACFFVGLSRWAFAGHKWRRFLRSLSLNDRGPRLGFRPARVEALFRDCAVSVWKAGFSSLLSSSMKVSPFARSWRQRFGHFSGDISGVSCVGPSSFGQAAVWTNEFVMLIVLHGSRACE